MSRRLVQHLIKRQQAHPVGPSSLAPRRNQHSDPLSMLPEAQIAQILQGAHRRSHHDIVSPMHFVRLCGLFRVIRILLQGS